MGYAQITAGSYSGDGIVNQGVIDDTGAGGFLQIGGNAFTNQGTIDVGNGETLNVYSTSFANSGTITVDGTSTILFDDTLTTAQLGTVNADSGATLDFAGGLDNTGATFRAGAGVVIEGSIDGGTIEGPINLTGSGQSLSLVGGPVVTGANGTGPGTINVTGEYASLYFDNTQTFDNATINLGNASGYYDYLDVADVSGAGNQVLTLGSGVTINIVGYAQITAGSYSGDGIINQGAIDDTGASGFLQIGGNAFTNQGTIDVGNGETLNVYSTSFANSGTITVDGTSTILFDDTLTTAQLGTVNAASGATLDFAGGLDNVGATLQVGSGVAIEGSIDGGTIEGPINLTGSGQSLSLVGGSVVAGANGTGPGTINVTGEYASLYFDNTQTFDNATINLGNASGYYDYLDVADVSGAGNQVLTLGSGVTINIVGYAQISAGSYSGDGIVSEGVVNDDGYLYLYGNAFTNEGTINDTTSGASLLIETTSFTNEGTINDTASALSIDTASFTNEGAINVANGQTLTVSGGTTFTNATGTITLDGTSSLVLNQALTTAQFGAVDAASGATLDFAGGLDNVGATLQVGSGVAVEGSIDGGTIDGAINLTGSGQSLSLVGGSVSAGASGTGPGTINVTGEYASLYFDNTQTFDNATINLGNASGYYDYLDVADVSGAGNQVLTLGSGVTINIVGYAQISAGSYSGDGIVSEGVVNDDGYLYLYGNAFTNEGTINDTTSGASLLIETTSFTNEGTINDTASALSIDTASFTNEGAINVANGQTLTVSGGNDLHQRHRHDHP